MDRVGVGVLHHLEAERRADALDAPMHDDEAIELQKLEAIDDRLLANTGQLAEAVERGTHLAILQGEIEQSLENARHGARDALLGVIGESVPNRTLGRKLLQFRCLQTESGTVAKN